MLIFLNIDDSGLCPLFAEALAASTVKIHGRDVIAIWKALVAIGLTPILYGFYSALVIRAMVRAHAPLSWTICMPIAVWFALFLVSFISLKFGDIAADILK